MDISSRSVAVRLREGHRHPALRRRAGHPQLKRDPVGGPLDQLCDAH